MKDNLKPISILFSVIIVSSVIILIFVNINNQDFFKLNFVNILTLIIAYYFSFFITQNKNDKRITQKYINDHLDTYINLCFSICNYENIEKDKLNKRLRILTYNIDLEISLVKKFDFEKKCLYKLKEFIELHELFQKEISNVFYDNNGDEEVLLSIYHRLIECKFYLTLEIYNSKLKVT